MFRKLVILIPAYNEEKDIEDVIRRLPRSIEGIEDIELVVINDGSTDDTLRVIRRAGVRHVINFDENNGLGRAFRAGLAFALKLGADIIVNIDADAQYYEADVEKIVRPVLSGRAAMAIGDRQLQTINEYPYLKLLTQKAGNLFVRLFFRVRAEDVTSGFRAISKDAALLLQGKLQNRYTYTIESLSLLAKQRIPVTFVPIQIRYPTRSSRLIKSKLYYGYNFLTTLMRCRLSKC